MFFSGAPGRLQTTEIDTANFKGNFPESCEMHALNSLDDVPDSDSPDWVMILPWVKLGPHRRHFFQLETKEGAVFTHVKMTIYPDGGVKRLRIIGTRGESNARTGVIPLEGVAESNYISPVVGKQGFKGKTIPVLPLTPEAFAPFGRVIQGYSDHAAVPPGTKITPANGGTASKFHKLALINSSYPDGSGATAGLSVFRCNPIEVVDGVVELKALERHPYTSQAFIPMGAAGCLGDEALPDPGSRYLVVVAHNGGSNDKPDLSTLRAFIASAAQGIMYNTAVWREYHCALVNTNKPDRVPMQTDQPMTVLYKVCSSRANLETIYPIFMSRPWI